MINPWWHIYLACTESSLYEFWSSGYCLVLLPHNKWDKNEITCLWPSQAVQPSLMNLSYHSLLQYQKSPCSSSQILLKEQAVCKEIAWRNIRKNRSSWGKGTRSCLWYPAVLGSVHSYMQSPISFRTKQPGLYLGTVRIRACAVLFNKDVHVSVSAYLCVYIYIYKR